MISWTATEPSLLTPTRCPSYGWLTTGNSKSSAPPTSILASYRLARPTITLNNLQHFLSGLFSPRRGRFKRTAVERKFKKKRLVKQFWNTAKLWSHFDQINGLKVSPGTIAIVANLKDGKTKAPFWINCKNRTQPFTYRHLEISKPD